MSDPLKNLEARVPSYLKLLEAEIAGKLYFDNLIFSDGQSLQLIEILYSFHGDDFIFGCSYVPKLKQILQGFEALYTVLWKSYKSHLLQFFNAFKRCQKIWFHMKFLKRN